VLEPCCNIVKTLCTNGMRRSWQCANTDGGESSGLKALCSAAVVREDFSCCVKGLSEGFGAV
jgi:hypothetical protein